MLMYTFCTFEGKQLHVNKLMALLHVLHCMAKFNNVYIYILKEYIKCSILEDFLGIVTSLRSGTYRLKAVWPKNDMALIEKARVDIYIADQKQSIYSVYFAEITHFN